MKKTMVTVLVLGTVLISGLCFWSSCAPRAEGGCLIGAFFSDRPSAATISNFQKDYGRKPFFVLTFLDWGKFPDENVIRDVYGSDCVLLVTWEPWRALRKRAIDYDAVLAGKDDGYIREFALRLKAIGRPVFLRFAHEMNGDWYPWSAKKIGPDKYQRLFRHVREVFDREQTTNIRWVFSINAENIPKDNDYRPCYPGKRFVDYVGLDGYNWGKTKVWSRWRSFKEIFEGVTRDVVRHYQKPVIISEFSSSSAGGDKARWIEDALQDVKKWPAVKGLILFNVDKETDWCFAPASAAGKKFAEGLRSSYYWEAPREEL